MKKMLKKTLKLSIIALLACLAALPGAAAATAGAGAGAGAASQGGAGAVTLKDVKEAKEVRIVIDGVPGAYSDTALRINDRILLPFREILTKLGVRNDDEHIIWNGAERSVTAKTDAGEIKLLIGDKTIMKDGRPIAFDVAPYIYPINSRTYVPVRAVAELMDKLVEWDGDSSTVYVRDKANYEQALGVLAAQRGAGGQLKRFRAKAAGSVSLVVSSDDVDIPGAQGQDGLTIRQAVNTEVEADAERDIFHMTQSTSVLGLTVKTEIYITKGRMFMKAPGAGLLSKGGWSDVTGDALADMSGILKNALSAGYSPGGADAERLALGFSVSPRAGGGYSIAGEFVNKSEVDAMANILLKSLNMSGDGADMGVRINRYSMESEIGKDYMPISAKTDASFDMSLTRKGADGKSAAIGARAGYTLDMSYSDVNASFIIALPAEVAALLAK
ncbi:MAG: copper amine oxidase N-terminal domain-containing protein [Clostridiales bacterium]|jgi:hypothetical protein|nr:copper amine oxidase N-terminal domain-containing protein [Clostridiales bacterium]